MEYSYTQDGIGNRKLQKASTRLNSRVIGKQELAHAAGIALSTAGFKLPARERHPPGREKLSRLNCFRRYGLRGRIVQIALDENYCGGVSSESARGKRVNLENWCVYKNLLSFQYFPERIFADDLSLSEFKQVYSPHFDVLPGCRCAGQCPF